jgi:hypothetical protein
MVAVPDWPVSGVMVAFRLAPLPLRTILLLGTSVGLEDIPERARSATGVSKSPMVRARANEVFSGIA